MDTDRFDDLTCAISTLLSRRALAAALGLGTLGLSDRVDAKKKRRKRKRKIERNDFGCVDIGNFCTKAKQCCSNICKWRKGKKTCRAHDAADCQAGQHDVNCGGADVGCTGSLGNLGVCETTTGNAPYCASSVCAVECRTDADCQSVCGPRAACLTCGYYCAGRPCCTGPEVCSGCA
jgi:hypothetical protein